MFGDRPGPSRDLRELAEAVRIQHDEVLKRLTAIDRRLRKMATHQDVKAAIDGVKAEIASAADRVSKKIQDLQDKIDAGGATPEQLQEDLDELQGEMDSLKEIGADTPPPAPVV